MRNSGKLTGVKQVTDNAIAAGQGEGKTFLGHPTGLFVLFFAEMWERFSYYGMRALLVLYLTKHFLFDREAAYGLYGAYTTLVYIGPVIGGFLADKYLGGAQGGHDWGDFPGAGPPRNGSGREIRCWTAKRLTQAS
jgi:POT family proton-dependent oligopeptide transporter